MRRSMLLVLAEALKVSTALADLFWEDNAIGAEGMMALNDGLCVRQCVVGMMCSVDASLVVACHEPDFTRVFAIARNICAL